MKLCATCSIIYNFHINFNVLMDLPHTNWTIAQKSVPLFSGACAISHQQNFCGMFYSTTELVHGARQDDSVVLPKQM